MATTRAIRRYTDDPIPDADLAEILWHAQRAPSGTNRQKFRFLTLRRDDPSRRAGTRAARPSRSARAGSASRPTSTATGAPDAGSPRARMQAAMQHYVDHIDAVPVVVLVGLERYRPANSAEGASVYPACQNLLLAAHALGYGGVLTGWHDAGRAGAARPARHPRRRRPARLHHARRAGRAATGRCAASRWGRSSTTGVWGRQRRLARRVG